MRNFTLRLNFLMAFLLLATLVKGQEVYQSVGIIGTATPKGWDASTPMKLVDASDPHQWTLTLYLTEGTLKFRANDSWEVNWGATDFPSGTASLNGADMMVPANSYYTITFNDASGAYHFDALSPPEYATVGIVGDATNEGWDTSIPMVKGADGHSWSLDYIELSAAFTKFRANNSWEVNWGGNSFPKGTATLNGADIEVLAGEYSISFNDVTGEYFFENLNPAVYESIGIIGSATAQGWDASTPMKLADQEDPHRWTLTVFLNQGDMKFRANNSWDVNWGSSEFPSGTALQDGPDIHVLTASYYTITFDDRTGDFLFTRLNTSEYETIGLIGSATPGQWDYSTPMMKGHDGHSWTLENFELSDGEVKFRANDSWEVNWGGTDFPSGTAVRAGGDIPVAGGLYNISFNDVTGAYEFQPVGKPEESIVVLSPALPGANEPVTIIYDASKGVGGLVGAAKVYMHSGVVLAGPDGTAWSHVVGNWGQDDGIGEMSPVDGEPHKWQISLPSVKEYYGVTDEVPVFRLGMVFRNANGTLTGKSDSDGDIYADLDPGDYVRFTAPAANEVFGVAGEQLLLSAEASGIAGSISLEIDEGKGFEMVAQANDSERISYGYSIGTATSLQLRVIANIDGHTITATRTLTIVLRQPNMVAELPAGMHNGINYDPADPGKATLVLLAPGKEFVYAVGDFNNWQVSGDYQMKQTPDGEYFWLTLESLEPGKEYVYQYWVNGVIKIGDPYADKVADPFHDGNIPAHVYPNPIGYTDTQNGIATVLQTAQKPYEWKFPQVQGGRPANEELVIYELLVRDFLGSHSYRDLADTLSYLKRLGVNAIELLPVMEFEANESWGYNPTYLFAPDKYYGTKNDLKAFIDKAHEEGMVVLLDMVLNHQFGQSPMVRMYFDEDMGRPSAESPWFNQEPTHPFNVGFDMNHESAYTKQYVDDVNRYWIEEYKFDGYRFDLSKGFTQRNNSTDVEAWSAYDQSRIDLLTRMADRIWEVDPEAYVILEHLGANNEEKALADYGMMLWGNMNHPYSDVINSKTGTNLNWTLSDSRGWDHKNLVSYMESHDEERLMVRALNEGGSSGDYDIRDFEVALERIKLASAFYYPLPGPKMIWQFGELGYDFPINYGGRTGNKPIPWGDKDGLNYHQDEERVKLYKAKAAIIGLVNEYSHVFEDGDFSWTPSGQFRRINIGHDEMNVSIVGNFGLSEGSMEAGFQHTGTWYDFFSGQPIEVNATTKSISLLPGEFHIYLSKPVAFPEPGLVRTFAPIVSVKPGTFTIDDQVRITFDAAAANPDGTGGLLDAEKVYFRGGLVSEGPESNQVDVFVGSSDADDGVGLMSKVPGDNALWTIVLRPHEYFNIEPGQGAYRIGMYFRDAGGQNVGKNKDGGLLFVDIEQKQEMVWVEPSPFTADDEIRILFDANQADPAGTAGLMDAAKVYMHSGVVVSETDAPLGNDWRHVQGNWGQDDGLGQMSKVAGEDQRWEITLRPRDYYGLEAASPVYYLAMVFRNANGSAEGKGPGGSDIFIRVAQDALVAPTNLQAVVEENLAVELSWTDNAEGELGYVLERMAENKAAFETLAILDENATAFTDRKAIDGVAYAYRIKAISAFTPDSEYSNIALADLPLLAPENLTAHIPDRRQVLLAWEDLSENETAYVIERAMQRGRSPGPYSVLAELPANTTSYLDAGVRPGVVHYYRVVVRDEDEYSGFSNEINIRAVAGGESSLKEQLRESLRLYPNPTGGPLTVSTDMELLAPLNFQLSNMQGKVLKSFQIMPENKTGSFQVDVSGLKNGIYLLQATYMEVQISMLLQVKH